MSINFISRDLAPTALTWVRSVDYNVCGVVQQRVCQTLFSSVDEFKKRLVKSLHWSGALWTLLSTNLEKASACLCSHKRPIFRTFTVSSWTTGQLGKLSAKVTKISTKCALRVLFYLSNQILPWIRKCNISLVLFFPGSAEADVRWVRKLNYCLLMASWVRYIYAKNY